MTGAAHDPRVAGARLAIWTHGVPHPTEGASTVLYWQYVHGLRTAGFEVLSVLLVEPQLAHGLREYEALARADGIAVSVCEAPSFLEERRHAVRLRTDALRPALAAAAAFEPDLHFGLDFLAGWAARAAGGPRVVWLGDLRFLSTWYHALYEARERPVAAVQLPLAFVRSLAWRRAYGEALEGAEVIVSSKSSEAVLGRMGVRSEYQPYPWPSDEREPSPVAERPERPTFLFLGTLGALGSRSAFHFLLRRLYPKLVDRWGHAGFRVLIAGRGSLPEWAARAIAETPELEHLGFVEDLTALLGRVHAAIAPISVPVGNRSRILTALAAGTVVVAHENAALGNPDLADGGTCYLAGDAESFAERMARTVDSPAEARAVAERGRELYRRLFRPEVAVGTTVDTLASVLSTDARRAAGNVR